MPIWQCMGRKPRLVVADHPHHVYQRGNNRRLLFSSHGDRVFWIACMRRALDATGCRLHQMTLMSNHVHAIITPPDADALSELMKRANQRYAQTRNQQRGGSGKLFEERFRSVVIDDVEHLRVTTLYNDANAYRAKMVTDPFAHDWSTVPLHAAGFGGRFLRSLWTPSAWYQGLGATPMARAVAYRHAMIQYLELEDDAAIDDEIKKREARDAEVYRRRVERPGRGWAREAQSRYGRKRERTE